MKRRAFLKTSLAASVLSCLPSGRSRADEHAHRDKCADDDGWVRIFNGEDLAGWWIMGNARFEVADGAICATKDGLASGGYAMTCKDDYTDFELKLEAYTDFFTDSGIALRDVCTDPSSQRGDGWHCCVDYRPNGPFSGIYYKDASERFQHWKSQWPFVIADEKTIEIRNADNPAVKQFITADEWKSLFKLDGWNAIKIRFVAIRPCTNAG